MEIKVNENSEISVLITKKVTLSDIHQRRLIKKVVTQNEYYKEEEAHDRWSALYNAYDMLYDCDIRSEHKEYNSNRCCNMSRINFLISTNRISKLLCVASKLYKKEFEQYVSDYLE